MGTACACIAFHLHYIRRTLESGKNWQICGIIENTEKKMYREKIVNSIGTVNKPKTSSGGVEKSSNFCALFCSAMTVFDAATKHIPNGIIR